MSEAEVESPADAPPTAPEASLDSGETPTSDDSDDRPAPEPDPRAWIRLHRTACYGPCPVYVVTLYDDGEVVWEGLEFVNRIGPAHSRISGKTVQRLIERFEDMDLDGVPEDHPGYGRCATDSASSVIESSSPRATRKATHYYGCRGAKLAALGLFEKRIDRAADSKAFIEEPACEAMTVRGIYYLGDDTSVDDGREPVHEVRREELGKTVDHLRRHRGEVVRLRAVMDGKGLAPVRLANYAQALHDRGIAEDRVITYLHEPTTQDPMGWNFGRVSIDLGSRDCLEIR